MIYPLCSDGLGFTAVGFRVWGLGFRVRLAGRIRNLDAGHRVFASSVGGDPGVWSRENLHVAPKRAER